MSRFWIAGAGGSGTMWLARRLNSSPTHEVYHEEADPVHDPSMYWRPFPLERWKGNHGECHSQLISHLSPLHHGAEREISHRYILHRPAKDVIRCWMNRDDCTHSDLGSVIHGVLTQQKRVLDYCESDPGCKRLYLDDLTTGVNNLQRLVDELGLGFAVTPEMTANRVNAAKTYVWNWDIVTLELFKYIKWRYGHPDS